MTDFEDPAPGQVPRRRGRRASGAVDRLPSGRWRARFRSPDGGRVTATFALKAQADQWLAAQMTDVGRGAWVDPRAGAVTLSDYAGLWLERRPDLQSRTQELYRYLLDRYIEPELGGVQLGRLSPSRVRAWHADLRARVPTTAAKAYRLLSSICATAVADELIARSPCRVAGAGVEKAEERPVATVAEVAALVKAMPERFRIVVELATWCGLRRGEILGLRRRDVDVAAATVTVARAMQQLNDGTLLFGRPKTRAGARTIAIPRNVLPALRTHLEQFVQPGPDALVVTGRKGGPVRPHVLQAAWDRARTVIGREDLHLHDLRHTGNTWAAATGASTRELMARMGHASPAAALRYQHATADRDRVIAEALAQLAEAASSARITDLREFGSRSGHARGSGRTSRKGATRLTRGAGESGRRESNSRSQLGNQHTRAFVERERTAAERKPSSAGVPEQRRNPMEEYGCAINAPWRALELVIELPGEVADRLEERAAEAGITIGEAVASVLMSILADG